MELYGIKTDVADRLTGADIRYTPMSEIANTILTSHGYLDILEAFVQRIAFKPGTALDTDAIQRIAASFFEAEHRRTIDIPLDISMAPLALVEGYHKRSLRQLFLSHFSEPLTRLLATLTDEPDEGDMLSIAEALFKASRADLMEILERVHGTEPASLVANDAWAEMIFIEGGRRDLVPEDGLAFHSHMSPGPAALKCNLAALSFLRMMTLTPSAFLEMCQEHDEVTPEREFNSFEGMAGLMSVQPRNEDQALAEWNANAVAWQVALHLENGEDIDADLRSKFIDLCLEGDELRADMHIDMLRTIIADTLGYMPFPVAERHIVSILRRSAGAQPAVSIQAPLMEILAGKFQTGVLTLKAGEPTTYQIGTWSRDGNGIMVSADSDITLQLSNHTAPVYSRHGWGAKSFVQLEAVGELFHGMNEVYRAERIFEDGSVLSNEAFVIYSPEEAANDPMEENAGFWNETDGWTVIDGATRYSTHHARHARVPAGAALFSVDNLPDRPAYGGPKI